MPDDNMPCQYMYRVAQKSYPPARIINKSYLNVLTTLRFFSWNLSRPIKDTLDYKLLLNILYVTIVADPKILKGGRAEDNLSAPSSFIANAHNEIYSFYTEKAAF